MWVPLVENGKIFPSYKKESLGLLFFATCFIFKASASVLEDPIQKEFKLGLTYMLSSNYSDAEKLFSDLFAKTNAPRIKLEWARASYLNKNYEMSKKLFEEVLDVGVPESVRFNIMQYLNQINQLTNYVDYRISYIRDTNPQNSSNPQTILIYGIPFEYNPIKNREDLNGINIGVYYSRRLTDIEDLRIIIDLDLTKYFDSDLSEENGRFALESSLNKKLNLKYRLGYESFWKDGENLLNQHYGSILYSNSKMIGFYDVINSELKYSKSKYVEFADASGDTASFGLGLSKGITQSLQLYGSLYYDNTQAKIKSYDYQTLSSSVGIKIYAPIIQSYLKLAYSGTLRKYGDLDELFIIKRSDINNTIGATLMPYNIKMYGLYPALNIEYKKVKSNIAVNSFDTTKINLTLNKKFK